MPTKVTNDPVPHTQTRSTRYATWLSVFYFMEHDASKVNTRPSANPRNVLSRLRDTYGMAPAHRIAMRPTTLLEVLAVFVQNMRHRWTEYRTRVKPVYVSRWENR